MKGRFFKKSPRKSNDEPVPTTSTTEQLPLTNNNAANATQNQYVVPSAPSAPGIPTISPMTNNNINNNNNNNNNNEFGLQNLQQPRPIETMQPLPVTQRIVTPITYPGQGPVPPSSRAAATQPLSPVVYDGPESLKWLAKYIPQYLWLSLAWCLLWFLLIFIGLCVNIFAKGDSRSASWGNGEITCRMDSFEADSDEWTYIDLGDEYTYEAGKGVKWCSILSIILLFGVWFWSILINAPQYPYYRPFRVLGIGIFLSGLLFIIGSIIWLEMEQCTENTMYTGDIDNELDTGASLVLILLGGIFLTILGIVMILQIYSIVELTVFKAYFIPPQYPHVIQAVLQTQQPSRLDTIRLQAAELSQQPGLPQTAHNTLQTVQTTQSGQQPGYPPTGGGAVGVNGIQYQQQMSYPFVMNPNIHQQWSMESSDPSYNANNANYNANNGNKYGMRPVSSQYDANANNYGQIPPPPSGYGPVESNVISVQPSMQANGQEQSNIYGNSGVMERPDSKDISGIDGNSGNGMRNNDNLNVPPPPGPANTNTNMKMNINNDEKVDVVVVDEVKIEDEMGPLTSPKVVSETNSVNSMKHAKSTSSYKTEGGASISNFDSILETLDHNKSGNDENENRLR